MVNCICSAASFGSAALRSALPFAFSAPPVKKAFGALRRACRGKAPPSANADRSAAQKPHWGFHCYAALRKRGRSKREIKNNYSAEDAQSASGGHSQSFLYKKPAGIVHGGLWFTVYSALVSGFASALASGFAAGAAAGAAGFTTGFGGLGSSFSGNRMMCLGHFWAHIPQPLHLS